MAEHRPPAGIKAEVTKLEFLRGLGADGLDLSVLPAERRRFLATVGRRLTAQALDRREPQRSYPILLCAATAAPPEGVRQPPRPARRIDDRDITRWSRDWVCSARWMDQQVRAVIDELTAQAEEHDAAEADRLRRWRVLEEPAGQLLGLLVRAAGVREVVEIGTSRGVSTLWLAEAVRATDGRVVGIDTDADAQQHAAASLARAGLAPWVTLRQGGGGQHLAARPDDCVDLLFLDAERTEYPAWWPHPVRVLRPGGLLVADNATSHPEEIAPLAALLQQSLELSTTMLEIGKGELVAVRDRQPDAAPRVR